MLSCLCLKLLFNQADIVWRINFFHDDIVGRIRKIQFLGCTFTFSCQVFFPLSLFL